MKQTTQMPVWVALSLMAVLALGIWGLSMGWLNEITRFIATLYGFGIAYALFERFPASSAEELLATRVGLVVIFGSAIAGMFFGGIVAGFALLILLAAMLLIFLAALA